MKQILYLITCLLFLSATSCSVYENIYFLENGKVSYSIDFDAKEMMAMASSMSKSSDKKLPKDSVIPFADIIKEKMDIGSLSEKELKRLEYVSNFSMRIQSDEENKKLNFSIFGDFNNTDELNKALYYLNQEQKKSGNKSRELPLALDKVVSTSIFTWDGDTMTRNVVVDENEDKAKGSNNDIEENDTEESNEDQDINTDSSINSTMSQLFSEGRMIVKYHFPKKVESISNPNAMISQDGKTVIIEYPAMNFAKPDSMSDIKIKLAK